MKRNYELPEEIKVHLDGWQEVGLPLPPFLHAVLSNDLRRAIMMTDAEGRKMLPDLVKYVWDEVDANAHGSLQAVQAWQIFKQDQARGKGTPLEMCRQKVGDYSLLESKSWQEILELLTEFIEFLGKDKQECELGVIPMLVKKARHCLKGEHIESLGITITKGEG